MVERRYSGSDEQDDTLSKLETALDDATSVDLRAAIESAIEERKRALRQQSDSAVSPQSD
ncbi:hypothetical protein ACFQMA_05030 [Halosimplex aquaticum]|uniref:Uncharacterized protein n=1 Tax=Halosimplex aquaticum TaxID=3026162 RepID=A0ABD5XX54_9EURY|nr:hypothetical protein [Halosimplex aquaticum]